MDAKGKLSVTYHIEIMKAGMVSLPQFEYSYFEPKTAEYKVLSLPEMRFDIEPLQNAIADIADGEDFPQEQEQFVANEVEDTAWYESPVLKWVGGGVPFLALMFLLVTRIRKKTTRKKLRWSPWKSPIEHLIKKMP